MKHTRATASRMQLDEYVRIVPQIYSAHDRNRSLWDVWCHTLHHGAGVAERLRKEQPADKLFKEIADFALWLFTVVQKLSGRPGRHKGSAETPVETLIRIQNGCSDLVWHRYPGVCHICYARRSRAGKKGASLLAPCDCSPTTPDLRDKDAKRSDLRALWQFSHTCRSRKPSDINAWQAMFAEVFGTNIKRLSPIEIGFHLMEELGEVSDAMVRMYSYRKNDFRTGEPNWRQARLEAQIADVFSWLFALSEKLNELKRSRHNARLGTEEGDMSAGQRITLSGIIWLRYGSERLGSFRCPSCDKRTCSCP